uniref:NBS-LRR type resistance protein n=1 Tax=Cucumis melo TaxID=3656 RepID=A0A9I9EF65_CUCME
MLELQSKPTPKGTQPLSGMRYARLCWIDDWATQKALVRDPSPRPARRPMRAVPRPHICSPQTSGVEWHTRLVKRRML